MKGRIAVLTYAEPRVRQLVSSFMGGAAWATSQTLLLIPQKEAMATVISEPEKITKTLIAIEQSEDSKRFATLRRPQLRYPELYWLPGIIV